VRSVVPQATITVEDRNQFGRRTSTCVHQVSVTVGDDVIRRANQDPELLRRQLEEMLDQWVTASAGRVQGEMTLAERQARRAVID
jgi:hypothetical protein